MNKDIPRFLRLKNIIGDPKANPPIPAIIPISKSSWWNGIKSGRYPKPIKLGKIPLFGKRRYTQTGLRS